MSLLQFFSTLHCENGELLASPTLIEGEGVWIFPENGQTQAAYFYDESISFFSLVKFASIWCIEKAVCTDSDQLHMERPTCLMSKKHV
jgi:hypothetical protein